MKNIKIKQKNNKKIKINIKFKEDYYKQCVSKY